MDELLHTHKNDVTARQLVTAVLWKTSRQKILKRKQIHPTLVSVIKFIQVGSNVYTYRALQKFHFILFPLDFFNTVFQIISERVKSSGNQMSFDFDIGHKARDNFGVGSWPLQQQRSRTYMSK